MRSFSLFAALSASIAALGVAGLTLEDRPPIVYNPLEKRGLEKRHYGSFVCVNQQYNNWCKTLLQQQGTSTATVGCGQDQNGNDQCYATCVNGYTRSSDGSLPLCTLNCAAGLTLSADRTTCVNLNTDVNNCGTLSKACTVPTNGSPTCTNGNCGITCNTGYTVKNGACSPVTTVTCPSGQTLTSDGKSCVNLLADVNNCGALGKVCTDPANGSPTCQNKVCGIACDSGYTLSGSTCVAACKDGTDPTTSNCGRYYGCTSTANCVQKSGNTNSYCIPSQNACFTPSSNTGGQAAGTACGNQGYAAGDDNQCAAGLICINYTCTSPFSSDASNCGTAGTVCSATGTGVAGAQCVNSSCQVTCGSGYAQSADKKSCVATSNDPKNCGGVGTVCPTTGTGVTGAQCQNSSCQVTCGSGYAQSADKKSCVSTTNDPNNCGGLGQTCSATGTGVTGAQCVASSCQVTCGSGYTQSADKKSCTATVTCKDGSVLSNGSCVRNTCGSTADCVSKLGTQATGCYGGACYQPSSNANGLPEGSKCGNGPNGDDNQCAANLVCFGYVCYNAFKTDAQNCGSFGNACPATGNGIATSTCSNSKCVITCSPGYNPATDGSLTCVSQASDPNNCGGAGKKCPTVGNGVASSTCQNNACVLTCSNGYTLTSGAAGQSCVSQASDPKNCGGPGNTCAAVGNGVATSTCQNNACVLTCSSGYTLSADKTSCGALCKDGAQPNGSGGCIRATCSTAADCVQKIGIAGAQCNYNTCYAPSSNSAGLPVGSKCGVGAETAPPGNDNTCITGAICLNYVCTRAYNDVNNCGSYKYSCAANAGTGYVANSATCTNGQCTVTCTSLYNSVNGVCVLKASAAPRQKKRAQKPVTLCPAGETACPIAGSASFSTFSQSKDNASTLARSAGGYECLDTSSAVESCGGCASTGEGFDCTRIRHSSGVGCSSGQCVVLSCNKGYAVSASGSKCVKIHTGAARRHKGVSSGLIH